MVKNITKSIVLSLVSFTVMQGALATVAVASESMQDSQDAQVSATLNHYIDPFPGGYYVRDLKRDVTGQNLIDGRNYWDVSKKSYDACFAKYSNVRPNGRYVILFDSKVVQRHIYTHTGTSENFRCSHVGFTGGMSLEVN